MKSRRLLCMLVPLALGVLLARPAGAGEPAVQPANRPTALGGVENGAVPDSRLITAGPGCKVAREAGPSLALLFRIARMSGVQLTGRDCYRPVAGQIASSQQATAAGNSACAATPAVGPNGRVKGTSYHGWGKALDFGDPASLGFRSTGYSFLKGHAAALGWNHPAFAEPGGSACPEAWHWEWVGDGGNIGGDPVPADIVAVLPHADDAGYSVVTGLGAVHTTSGGPAFGGVDDVPLSWVVVGAAATPDRGGYWMVGGDGGVFTFGNAPYAGSTGAMRLNQPVIGMAPTPTGRGYWLVAADGGIFSFGDAVFHGSTGAMRLNAPIAGMATTADGTGYRLVATDGGIFTFGSATFRGSATSRFRTPAVGIVATKAADGYWVVAADGGVAKF